MTDVLLVNPPSASISARLAQSTSVDSLSFYPSMPPLGLGYIAGLLLKHGFDTRLLDMNIVEVTRKQLIEELRRRRPRLVGIATYTESYPNSLQIASIAKECDPQCTTILGGPHVTFTDRDTLQNKQVDYVVRHEGEITMLELTRHIMRGDGLADDLEGITYRKNGRVIRAPD